MNRFAATGCGAPDRTTIVSEPRTAPSDGMTYFVFGLSAEHLEVVAGPGVADPDLAARELADVVRGVRPDERLLLLEEAEDRVEIAVVVVLRREPSRNAPTAKHSRSSSSMFRWPLMPSSQRAAQLVRSALILDGSRRSRWSTTYGIEFLLPGS